MVHPWKLSSCKIYSVLYLALLSMVPSTLANTFNRKDIFKKFSAFKHYRQRCETVYKNNHVTRNWFHKVFQKPKTNSIQRKRNTHRMRYLSVAINFVCDNVLCYVVAMFFWHICDFQRNSHETDAPCSDLPDNKLFNLSTRSYILSNEPA